MALMVLHGCCMGFSQGELTMANCSTGFASAAATTSFPAAAGRWWHLQSHLAGQMQLPHLQQHLQQQLQHFKYVLNLAIPVYSFLDCVNSDDGDGDPPPPHTHTNTHTHTHRERERERRERERGREDCMMCNRRWVRRVDRHHCHHHYHRTFECNYDSSCRNVHVLVHVLAAT